MKVKAKSINCLYYLLDLFCLNNKLYHFTDSTFVIVTVFLTR